MRPSEYASRLVELQGIDKALQIVTNCVNDANKTGGGIYFYDEVNWSFNSQNNSLVFPKELDKKHAGLKAKRESNTKNFFTAVLQELNRKVKNA